MPRLWHSKATMRGRRKSTQSFAFCLLGIHGSTFVDFTNYSLQADLLICNQTLLHAT